MPESHSAWARGAPFRRWSAAGSAALIVSSPAPQFGSSVARTRTNETLADDLQAGEHARGLTIYMAEQLAAVEALLGPMAAG